MLTSQSSTRDSDGVFVFLYGGCMIMGLLGAEMVKARGPAHQERDPGMRV